MPSKTGSKPEKTMSSRLMTMGFMQRSAAAKQSQQESTEAPRTPDSKRPRLSTEASPEPAAQSGSDLEAIAAAIAAEEEKRREALSKQAAEAGDTEWVLDHPGVNQQAARPLVVAAGSLDDDDMSYGGRQAYGNFKRKKKTGVAYGNPDEEEMDEAQIESRKKLNAEKRNQAKSSSGISSGGGRQGLSELSMSQKKRKQK